MDNLRYWSKVFIVCHFFVKTIIFFDLIQAISFSIYFTFNNFNFNFEILYIYKTFFPEDLYTYNLNISRM